MKRFCFLILSILLLNLSILGEEEEKPEGLNHFNIINLAIDGQIEEVEAIDVNQDGLKDLLITSFIRDKASYRYRHQASIFFQKKDKGFDITPDYKWDFDPKATAIIIGKFTTDTGVQIGYLTKDAFWVYYFAQPENTGTTPPSNGIHIASKKLLDVSPIFAYPDKYSLHIWQKPIDLDNNGYDDIIIPTSNGYQIYFQEAPGGKFTPCIIDVPSEKRLETNPSSFIIIKDSLPNIFMSDINNDGFKDIILYNKGKLSYYLQEKTKPFAERFSSKPSGEISIKILQDDFNPNQIKQASIDLLDINKDGLIDLVVSVMQGGIDDLDRLRTQIAIFFGRKSSEGKDMFYWPESPDQIINVKGIVPLIAFDDVNEDGNADLITASFQMDFLSNLKKVFVRYLKLTYRIQAFQPKIQQFSDNPDYERTINFPLDLIGKGQKYFSHIYFKNFDGDGRPDILTISGPDEDRGKLLIRLARNRKELDNQLMISFYKDDYLLYPLQMPNKATVLDINSNGKNDIILQYRSRIIIMLSK